MKSPLLAIDTLDDRREVHRLLGRLPPKVRVAFLEWCCSTARPVMGRLPVASRRMLPTVVMAYRCDRADLRVTNEVYTDLLVLAADYDLDLAAAAVELEKWVRYPARSCRAPHYRT